MDQDKSIPRQKAEWKISIESAARKFLKASDVARRAPKKTTTETMKKTQEVVICMRVLVAACEHYQREVPGAREETEELLRQLGELRRNKGEQEQV